MQILPMTLLSSIADHSFFWPAHNLARLMHWVLAVLFSSWSLRYISLKPFRPLSFLFLFLFPFPRETNSGFLLIYNFVARPLLFPVSNQRRHIPFHFNVFYFPRDVSPDYLSAQLALTTSRRRDRHQRTLSLLDEPEAPPPSSP